MRYVKIVLSAALTVILCFGFFRVFGKATLESAARFTFSSSVQNYSFAEDSANFEDNFLMFTSSYEQTENVSAPEVSTLTNSNEAVAVNLSALSGKYKNYNGTALINNTDYSVSDIMNDSYQKPPSVTDEPYILIYHTHTSEGYSGGGTVVDVGNTMAQEFERLGYKTIHLTDVYDKEQFSGAYSRSRAGALEVLEKYPSIKLVFDVHRDSITADDGTVYKPVTIVDSEECAQVMFVCGTDSKGLVHPNWRENFKFALDVSRIMGKNYAGLSRPVNLRADRFNTHLTDHCFLMEMGSNANTLEQANRAAVYTARSVIAAIEK